MHSCEAVPFLIGGERVMGAAGDEVDLHVPYSAEVGRRGVGLVGGLAGRGLERISSLRH